MKKIDRRSPEKIAKAKRKRDARRKRDRDLIAGCKANRKPRPNPTRAERQGAHRERMAAKRAWRSK